MDKQLYTVECDPVCAFMVRSHNEKELTNIVKNHAKNMHQDNLSDEDVKKSMKTSM